MLLRCGWSGFGEGPSEYGVASEDSPDTVSSADSSDILTGLCFRVAMLLLLLVFPLSALSVSFVVWACSR